MRLFSGLRRPHEGLGVDSPGSLQEQEQRDLDAALAASLQPRRSSSHYTAFLDGQAASADEALALRLQQQELEQAAERRRSSAQASTSYQPQAAVSARAPAPYPAQQPAAATAPPGWDPFTADSLPSSVPNSTAWQPASQPAWPSISSWSPSRPPQQLPRQHHQQQQSPAPRPASWHLPDTSEDEALAKALQASLDSLPPPQQHAAKPQAAPAAQPAAGPRAQLNGHAHQQPVSSSGCAGCGGSLWGWERVVEAAGRRFHQRCLTCACCNSVLGTGTFIQASDQQLYHPSCHKRRFHPTCAVCNEYLPKQGDAIHWVSWALQDKCCPAHSTDGTARCCGCGRLCPRAESWPEVEQGRNLCLACLDSVVVDTQDAQPLYSKVLAFFAQQGMPLKERVPLLLVDSQSLGNAREREGERTHVEGGHTHDPISGPIIHTRGLCLWKEYRSIRTVVRARQGGSSFWSTRPELVNLQSSSCEITAILVLCGLPWLLTGSILAHEAMHAWLRLSGYPQLPPVVEEGLCQLMATLWLEQQPSEPEGSWEQRLMSICAHNIRTDKSPVYGDGFRASLEAFQRMGLPALLSYVRQHSALPA